jgi:hypothetical protein
MGPKEHKQMEFRTQQRIRKKGERHNNKALKQVQLLLLLLLLLLDWNSINKGCVSYTVALPFTLKSILRRQKKKNYENSNILPCKNITFKKSPKIKIKIKILQDIITL